MSNKILRVIPGGGGGGGLQGEFKQLLSSLLLILKLQ